MEENLSSKEGATPSGGSAKSDAKGTRTRTFAPPKSENEPAAEVAAPVDETVKEVSTEVSTTDEVTTRRTPMPPSAGPENQQKL